MTITNPWDSGDEIELSKEQYFALFDNVEKIDLSSDNPQQNYLSYASKIVIIKKL